MNRMNRKILQALTGDAARTVSGSHMHILGSSGVGKSKFLESIIQDAIDEDYGVCLIDRAGTLYEHVLTYLSYVLPDRPVILLNPSDPRFITPYNPFIDPGDDIGTTVSRRIDLTVKPWDARNTNQTPRLERICRILYSFAIAANETLPNAAALLEYDDDAVMRYALQVMDAPAYATARRQLAELSRLGSVSQWWGQVESTDNRLTRFLGPLGVRRFIGSKTGNLDIGKVLADRAILLVNLQHSGYLDDDAARLFASLLLSDFFSAARKRAGTTDHYIMVLDEFQEYMNLDLARMLDGVRKCGLHLVMAHQHLGHLAEDVNLRKSILGNARIKAVFGGIDYEDAVIMAHELHLDGINERDVVETLTRQEIAGHRLQVIPTISTTTGQAQHRSSTTGQATSRSSTFGRSANTGLSWTEYDRPGGIPEESSAKGHHEDEGTTDSTSESLSFNDSVTHGMTNSASVTAANAYFMVPEYREAVAGYVERSREDRVGKFAAALKNQPDRHVTIKIKELPAESHKVPFVDSYETTEEIRSAYETQVYRAIGARSPEEADAELANSRASFLEIVRLRSKKRPSRKLSEPAPSSDEDPASNTKRPTI